MSKRINGDWKPKLPSWHNITLLPFPATRVDINSNNVVSSGAFIANISSVHIVPTVANAAMSDAQLWGKMMLNARLADQPYIKHRLGWMDGHRDVEMDDAHGEEENKDKNSDEDFSDEDGGVGITAGIAEEEINNENSENDLSDEEGGVKIRTEIDEADIQNQFPEPEEMDRDREMEVTDVAQSKDEAKGLEAKKKHRREQAKRIRQRSLRWLSSAQLTQAFER